MDTSFRLNVTPAEWERIASLGSGVLFREGGIATSSLDDKGTWTDIPPYEFVEAAAACETCGGTGSIEGRNIASWDLCYADDCHDGKRRVAVVVPCPIAPMTLDPCVCDNGTLTVGHVVVTWGPLVVVDENAGDEQITTSGLVLVADGLVSRHQDERWEYIECPPDTDPQSLVGQYAIGIQVVS